MAKQNWFKRLFAEAPAKEYKPTIGTVKDAEGEAVAYYAAASQAAVNPNTFADDEGKTLVETVRWMEKRDPYLFGLAMTRKIAITGLKRQITGGDPGLAEFVQDVFAGVKNFSWIMYQMLMAIPAGFSITEVIWNYNGNYDSEHPPTWVQKKYPGKDIFTDLKPRYQDKFIYDKEFKLKLITKENRDGIYLPEKKFLEFSYMAEYGNKHGQALYDKLYWYWYCKENATKFYSIMVERHACPITVVDMPQNADPADVTAVDNFLAHIKTASGLKVPFGFVVKYLEADKQSSANTYEQFMEFLNRGEAVATLGQTLTSSAEQSGSLAMAKVQNLVRGDILQSDITMVSAIFNDYLIPWLVDYNFPNVSEYPKWELVIDEAVDLLQLATVLEKLMLMGYNQIPVAWVAKTFNIPLPEGGEAVIEKTAQATFSEMMFNLEGASYKEAMKKL